MTHVRKFGDFRHTFGDVAFMVAPGLHKIDPSLACPDAAATKRGVSEKTKAAWFPAISAHRGA